MTMFNRILYATDFSSHAEAAGNVALQLAHHPGTEVWAIHVVEPMMIPMETGDEPAQISAAVWDMEFASIEQEAVADERTRLHDTLAGFRGAGIPVHELVVEGDAALTVVREAKEISADLIVIGRHGRHTLTDLLIGSTAAKISKHAPCPVLTMCACAAVPQD